MLAGRPFTGLSQACRRFASSVAGFSGEIPMRRVKVTYARSSGPGGQHVNQTESKAELRFAVAEADWMGADDVRAAFAARFAPRINAKGELVVRSERTRSQALNLADCFDKVRFSIREVEEELAAASAEPSDEARAKWDRLADKAARQRLREKHSNSIKKQQRRAASDSL